MSSRSFTAAGTCGDTYRTAPGTSNDRERQQTLVNLHPRRCALRLIERLPEDVSPDEIIDALWAWATADPASVEMCGVAERRLGAIHPVELVIASRATRQAVILGMSRQIAVDIVGRLPEHASLDDVLVAVTLWRKPDESA